MRVIMCNVGNVDVLLNVVCGSSYEAKGAFPRQKRLYIGPLVRKVDRWSLYEMRVIMFNVGNVEVLANVLCGSSYDVKCMLTRQNAVSISF
jgi:hypothetical protein